MAKTMKPPAGPVNQHKAMAMGRMPAKGKNSIVPKK